MAQINNTPNTFTVLLAGFALGWLVTVAANPVSLSADVRKPQTPAAFRSGSERSVEVLEKISKQIATIDERLAAIEDSVVGKPKK